MDAPLRGSEICILRGKTSPFDDICDSANIREADRPKVFKQLTDGGAFIKDIQYIKNRAARDAIQNTIRKFYELLEKAENKDN